MSTVNAGWRGPNIVTDGLVMYLEASSGTSYSPYTSGVTWRDLSGNNNSSSLVNGPTYSPVNGGNIIFDGVNDYGSVPTGTVTAGSVSMLFWISGSYQNFCLSLFERSVAVGTGLTTPIPSNGWVQVGYMGVSGSANRFVINGTVYSANTGAGFPYDNATFKPIFWMGAVPAFTGNSNPNLSFHLQPSAGGSGGFNWVNFQYKAIGVSATAGNQRYFSGGIGTIQLYNRMLSNAEVLQNYNAQKSRFGL